MKAHVKEQKTTSRLHHYIKKTTKPTKTSATTESRLIRLVALETTATINTEKSRQTRPTSTDPSLPLQVNHTHTITPTTSTESFLEGHLIFTSPAVTTQKPFTKSEAYDTTTTSTEKLLILQTEQTTTISAIPVTSMKMKQPLTTTTGKMSIELEETPDNKAAHITTTSAQYINHTTPHAEKSEQQSTSNDMPDHWHLTTKSSMSATGLSNKQHLEYTKISSPLQSQPETISTTEYSPLMYKKTNSRTSTETTEATFIAETPRPEKQVTQQDLSYMLVYGKQASTRSRDLLTSSTLDAGNDSSVSWNTDTPNTVSERDNISNHSEPEITAQGQLTSSSKSSDAETLSPFNSSTVPPTILNSSSSLTVSAAPASELSSVTQASENVTSLSSTAAIKLTIIDRSTASSISTTDSADKESANPTSLLTSASSSGPHIPPIYLLADISASADSTIPAITSTTDSRVITDSSISVIDDLFSQSAPTVQLINISSTSATTDGPTHTAVTEETPVVISNTTASDRSHSVMSTQHSPLTNDETSTATPSPRNQKIILNATVVTG
jgi:hypothetical protein